MFGLLENISDFKGNRQAERSFSMENSKHTQPYILKYQFLIFTELFVCVLNSPVSTLNLSVKN